MFTVLRGFMWPTSLARAKVFLQNQKSGIHSKPPKDKIGPGQTFFTLSVFAASLLAPAGWILHHVPEYRRR